MTTEKRKAAQRAVSKGRLEKKKKLGLLRYQRWVSASIAKKLDEFLDELRMSEKLEK